MSILLVLVLLMVAATVEGNVSCITGSCDSREEIINVNQFTLESAWKGDLVAVQIMVKDWENDGWRLDWNSSGDEVME